MEYTPLDLGIDYLPYWDEPTDISESESETTTETTAETVAEHRARTRNPSPRRLPMGTTRRMTRLGAGY